MFQAEPALPKIITLTFFQAKEKSSINLLKVLQLVNK